jgi:hypothetical protein
MSDDDVFSGIKLSEQVGEAGVEQRLFSAPKPSKPAEQKPGNQETGKPGNWEVGKEGKREVSQEVSQEAKKEDEKAFNLEDTPTHKDSFLFTEEEFEALDDLKLEFRRRFDVKVTKNDLARCALQLLVEDYRQNQERSFLGRKLLRKPGKR